MKKTILILGLFLCTQLAGAQTKIDAAEVEKIIAKPQTQLLDVRTPQEYQGGHIPNSKNVDWKNQENFKNVIKELKKDQPVYVYCLSGGRSKQAAAYLANEGFTVFEYSGGMMDWRKTEKPEIKSETAEKVNQLTLEDYNKLIKSDHVVLINFSAVWCAPCQEMKPVLKEIETEYKGKMKLVQIDADINKDLLKALKIEGIPALILFVNGEKKWNKTGLTAKSEITKQLELVK